MSDLDLAFALAGIADEIAMEHYRAADLRVETKPDMTPVTEADRAIEQALRRRLAEERPADSVLGEEAGESGATQPDPSERRWILDPIDGTRNFSRGIPVFATLIALQIDGEVELGLVSAPALGRRWWAERGKGAFRDGEPMRASEVERLEDAVVSCELSEGMERLAPLAARAWHSRAFGDFWQHVLVAEGAVDVAIDPAVKIWDCAPLKVIVEEAGGRFTDLAGRSLIDGGSGVSTNGLLHDEVLAALGAG